MPVMPFLIASAPVRKGNECSFRSSDAVREASSSGSLCPTLNLLGLVGWMDLIARTHWRGTDGQRKRGGRGPGCLKREISPKFLTDMLLTLP